MALLHQEVADRFRNRILYRPQANLDVRIYSLPHLIHKSITSTLLSVHLWLLHMHLTWLTIGSTRTSRHIRLSLRLHNLLSVISILTIVCEEIILLRVNNSFYDFPCMISFFHKHFCDDVSDLMYHLRKTLEYLLDNAVRDLLKLGVGILN